jgi:predicted DNA binding protein
VKRLVVEFSGRELAAEPRFRRVESFEVLHILRLVPAEFAALVRVRFSDSSAKIDDLFPSSSAAQVEFELLDQEKDGFMTYFVKVRSRQGRQRPQLLSSVVSGSYLSAPFEFKDGKVKVTSLGDASQVREALRSLDRARLHYRVLSLMDARFSPSSPLGLLTEKQRRVLTKAYELGYYDRPKRIDSERLARELNITKSTLVAHRRKAERRLLAEILGEQVRPR